MVKTESALARYVEQGERQLDDAGTLRTWEDLRMWRVDRDHWSLEAADALKDAVGPRTAWWFLHSVTASRIARTLREAIAEERERLTDGLKVLRTSGPDDVAPSNPAWSGPRMGARITR